MPVIPVLLNGVRPNDAHKVVVVEEPPDGKVAERHAAPSQPVELKGATQQTVQFLKPPTLQGEGRGDSKSLESEMEYGTASTRHIRGRAESQW